MKHRLMISAAALALVAGRSLATAQGMNRNRVAAPRAAALQRRNMAAPDLLLRARRQRNRNHLKQARSSREDKTPGEKSKSVNSGNETQKKAEGRERREGRDNSMRKGREGRDSNTKADSGEGWDNNMKAEGREGR
jgi:hypothetical protein